ncbi:hypothetical protein Ciccas_001829 [Cichlidogyrus casuarinus]|uniref:Cell morphogenesis protein C-terminal domain-containing protein n=1 Tax=Cichlidogyrus casuarinus TaxID=1844966 RepID=A0ABD2QM27_9PLAT
MSILGAGPPGGVRRLLPPPNEVAETDISNSPIGRQDSPSLPVGGTPSQELQSDIICGIFLVSVCLLESDFEHEYIAGLRLLNRLLPLFYSLKKGNTSLKNTIIERLHKSLSQMAWEPKFPGVLNLVLKGLSMPNLLDPMYRLVVRIIPAIPSSSLIFLGNDSIRLKNSEKINSVVTTLVITLMPLLLLAWHEETRPQTENGICSCHCVEVALCPSSATPPASNSQIGNWTSSGPVTSNVDNTSPLANQSPALQMLCGVNSRGVFYGSQSETKSDADTNLPLCAFTVSVPSATINAHNPYSAAPQTGRNSFKPCNPLCIQAAESLVDLLSSCSWCGLNDQPNVARFANLVTMLRMYASSAFCKDSIQWTKCVMKYLYDGCGQSIVGNCIANLNAMISHGAACVHVPSLHLAYWLLYACVDFSKVDFQQVMGQFVQTVIDRFSGTAMWPEVVVLMHLMVSRSATMSSVPSTVTTTLPGLDPDGSGRVLDMNAAQAACAVPLPEFEAPRIQLAGKVLDVQLNIDQVAPLLAPQFAPSSLTIGRLHNLSRSPEHRVTFQDIWVPIFISASTGFRRPIACQSKVRERFASLLKCYGSRAYAGAPGNLRSPSVSLLNYFFYVSIKKHNVSLKFEINTL